MIKKFIAALFVVLLALPAQAIPTVTPPDSDLPQGYVVQNTDWNGMFDTLYNYLNGTVVPAINALQTAPPPNVGAQTLCNGRLTAATGVPVPVNDISSTSTIYFTPFQGNLVGIYSPTLSGWTQYPLTTDLSLAVPSGVRDLFDIYASWNGTSLVLTSQPYNTVTATNSPAAGYAVVINVPATTAFAVGDCVSLSSGSTFEEANITAISAGVSITVDLLQNTLTTPVVHSQQPTTAVAFQNGIPVLSSNFGCRYLGTIFVQSNALVDTAGCRGVGNFNYRWPRRIAAVNTSATYAQIQGTKIANAIKTFGTERMLIVAPQGNVNTPVSILRTEYTTGAASAQALTELFDGVQAPINAYFTGVTNATLNVDNTFTTAGRHAIDDYFQTTSTTTTITNTATVNSVTNVQLSGTNGWALN